MELIIPSQHKSGDRSFAELLLSPQQTLRARQMFAKCLKKSFDEDERRHGKPFRDRVQTRDEMKRRALIMAHWFRIFRGDLGYSMARCEAEMYNALRSEIDGELYTPPSTDRSFGVPEGELL